MELTKAKIKATLNLLLFFTTYRNNLQLKYACNNLQTNFHGKTFGHKL
jgi:hypothetical protein